jgi:hypothetical protein
LNFFLWAHILGRMDAVGDVLLAYDQDYVGGGGGRAKAPARKPPTDDEPFDDFTSALARYIKTSRGLESQVIHWAQTVPYAASDSDDEREVPEEVWLEGGSLLSPPRHGGGPPSQGSDSLDSEDVSDGEGDDPYDSAFAPGLDSVRPPTPLGGAMDESALEGSTFGAYEAPAAEDGPMERQAPPARQGRGGGPGEQQASILSHVAEPDTPPGGKASVLDHTVVPPPLTSSILDHAVSV